MRERHRQDINIFEDRPIFLPAILATMGLVFAVNLALRGEALHSDEKETIRQLRETEEIDLTDERAKAETVTSRTD